MEILTPWVSFCMSTYKRPEFLKDQISRLLKQTFTNFEIIISDNDPEASALPIIEEFNDPRIIYQCNGENLGMVKSFNRSVYSARGEFITMITDDDPVYPHMLETLYNLEIKHPGYGAYYGGCETLCFTKKTAEIMRSHVGINSALSGNMDWKEEKAFSGNEFLSLFLTGNLGPLLLWSVGVVKGNILVANGGMPEFGTEFFTDHAYAIVNCSQQGMVFVNESLGYQAIHGENFGFANLDKLEKYKATPKNFFKWVEQKLSKREDWNSIRPQLEEFTGRSMVEFSRFILHSLKSYGKDWRPFEKARKEVFYVTPFLRKWRLKYFLLTKFPLLFSFLLQLKQKISK